MFIFVVSCVIGMLAMGGVWNQTNVLIPIADCWYIDKLICI